MVNLSKKSFKCKNLLGDVVVIKPHWKSVRGPSIGRVSFRDRYVDVPQFGLKAVRESVSRGVEVRCPVQWYCHVLHKTMAVSLDAFPDFRLGFLCDCGKWVKKPGSLHTSFLYGVRVSI